MPDNHTQPHLMTDENIFFRCVEDCSEPIMLSDPRGKLVYVNAAWCQTYGYSAEEAVGQTPRLLRSEVQSEEFYGDMWRSILDPNVGRFKGEVVNRAKDGRLVPVLLTITPYHRSGVLAGYMGIAVDQSERRQLERQILRQDRLASVGMLASSMAHEIGNPLGVIRGHAEILMEMQKSLAENSSPGSTSAKAVTSGLDIIIGQIDRISKLIESLMRISRVPQEIALRPIRVLPAINELALLISESCKQKGIDIIVDCPDLKILADPHHLQQILLNLVINSMHAMEEETKQTGRSNHQLTIGARMVDQRAIELWVSDTGCGVTPEIQRLMFEPFYTTKALGQGTGLGLAIVARLLEEMKATIHVESPGPAGIGTTMRLHLLEEKALSIS